MAYEVKMHMDIKTFGPKTARELQDMIEKIISTSPEIRDALFLEFETDAPEPEKRMFGDILGKGFVEEVRNENR